MNMFLTFQVVHANGIWTVVYFIIIVCFGSFYLMNVTLAVVATSYEDEAIQTYEVRMIIVKMVSRLELYVGLFILSVIKICRQFNL